jgi:hypothetical protein
MRKSKIVKKLIRTNDSVIRYALKKDLIDRHASDHKVRIIEELGVHHGFARVDIAVINGVLHGYEIKSDRDTLERLPEQMNEFNEVFNKITLVVGKHHLYNAINLIPDWWGIVVAKIISDNSVSFNVIREAEFNKHQKGVSVAKLLWKKEAVKILEEYGEANGYYSKQRNLVYQKLSSVLDIQTLSNKVRDTLIFRTNWRPDSPPALNGG